MNDRTGSRTWAGRVVAASGRRVEDGVELSDVSDGAGVARGEGPPVRGPTSAGSGDSEEQAARNSAITAPAGPLLPTVPG